MPLPCPPRAKFVELVTWRPSLPDQAHFSSGIDFETGTIRLTGSGFWTEADANRYFDQQFKIVEQARRQFGHLKVAYDLRRWVVQSPDSAKIFTGMNNEIYRPDDRIVATAARFIDKQHSRIALGKGTREVFVSIEAAEQWLQAYHQAA